MLNKYGQGSAGRQFVAAQSPIAWYQFGVGITTATGVSQWNDQSGNANHLKQATTTAQPALQADGSILFDGVNHFLKCTAFTLNQPETIYLLFKQVSWTSGDYIFDGNVVNTGALQQTGGGSSPQIRSDAGLFLASDSNLAVGAYGIVCCVFNGASSSEQVNLNTANTGNASTGNMGGFTLGAAGNNGAMANIQVKEAIVFPAAHDATTQTKIIRYLAMVGSIAV